VKIGAIKQTIPSLSHSASDYSISASRRTTLTSSTSSPLPSPSYNSLPLPASSSLRAGMAVATSPNFEPDIVVALFSQLYDIRKPKNDLWAVMEALSPKDKDNYKGNALSSFISQMERIITALDDQRSKIPAATWASLFSRRSIRCKDILQPDKATHLQRVVSHYTEALKRKEDKDDPVVVMRLKTSERLLDFLSTHEVDPDSCLIGLPPSSEALSYVQHYIDLTLLSPSTPSSPSLPPPNNLHGSPKISVGNSSLNFNSSSVRPLPPNYQQLVSIMMEWSAIDDGTAIKEHIESLCSSFRGVNNIIKGDVVVVNIPGQLQSDDGSDRAFVYGRHTGARKNGLYEFFINPDESKRALVEAKNVFPITPHMKEQIRDLSTINSMVQNPADQFDKLLKGNICKEVEGFLEEQGIDIALVKRAYDQGAPLLLKDLPGLRKALLLLNKLLDVPPELFYKEMGFYSRALVSVHTRRLAANPTFTHLLSREATVNSLRVFANAPLAQNKIKAFASSCVAAFEQIDNKAKEILSGTKKRQLSDWWLRKIEISTDQFLCKRNFDFEAVPSNCILHLELLMCIF
jgi:hypothetical protein